MLRHFPLYACLDSETRAAARERVFHDKGGKLSAPPLSVWHDGIWLSGRNRGNGVVTNNGEGHGNIGGGSLPKLEPLLKLYINMTQQQSDQEKKRGEKTSTTILKTPTYIQRSFFKLTIDACNIFG